MIRIVENIGLIGVFIFPSPFLLQAFVKAIGILQAGNVATGAGIAVPVPGATNAIRSFVDSSPKAFATQVLQRVNTGEARTYYYCVKVCCC